MSLKAILIAAATLVSAVAATAGTANAGGKHFHGFHHNNHHFHHRHHGFRLVIAPSHRGCGFLREQWEETGSRYWRRRYFSCLNS